MEALTKDQLWLGLLRHEPNRAHRRRRYLWGAAIFWISEHGLPAALGLIIAVAGITVGMAVVWLACVLAGCQA